MSTSIRLAAIACTLVAASACKQRDPLYCESHGDDPRCGALDASVDAPADAPPGFVTISGTVFNLAGDGLILENNGADDLSISSSAGTQVSFQFTTAIQIGSTYEITASSQPNTPRSQTCTVVNGSGTAADNVTDVVVNCATNAFNVGGTLSGMDTGKTLVLLLNGGDALTVTDNGPFTFPAKVNSGDTFAVTIDTSPAGQTCTVPVPNGAVGTGDVTDIVVGCGTNTYYITGSISGLIGSVTLSDGTDSIQLAGNGMFSFPPLTAGASWNVSVMQQPGYPPVSQTCTVAGTTTGTTIGANINDIVVTCSTNAFPIGGTLHGLTGTLVLADNGTPTTPITANGPFTLDSILSGMTYLVSVNTQPSGQRCFVSNQSGTVTDSAITDVGVLCDSGIKCKQSFCDPSSQHCCDPTSNSASCSGGFCGSYKLSLPCDDAADCAWAGHVGNVCCASLSGTGTKYVSAVACATSCSGAGRVQLCNPDAPNECSAGKTCQAYNLFSGYYACQ